jgi:hypothetical protein
MSGRGRRFVLAAVAAAWLLDGCSGAPAPTPALAPAPSASIPTSGSAATDETRRALEGALRAAGFALETSQVPRRPPEPAGFEPLARVTLRAPLAADASGGLITIYEFADGPAAADAGASLAAYLGSGPTRIQYPPDARLVLRRVGSTLVFFSWSPTNAPDPRTADLAAAIATVGTEIPIRPF